MARATYQNDDIDIFLTSEEVNSLGLLEIVQRDGKSRLIYKPLEIQLSGSKEKLVIQRENFDDYGDGIKVERREFGFHIRLNDKAYWRMDDALGASGPLSRPLTGTRYDGMNKINFWEES